MSECITINSTELLPLEDTLLVHYTIICSGTWDILQTASAYRNVCDDYWTVMFPNIQHPRHTDFPIVVGNNPFRATFAWNFGGIQGISAENFDPNHSYLVQLGIFNSDCGQTGSGGGSTNTGQTGFTGVDPTGILPGGPSVGGPTWVRNPPAPISPPVPGTPTFNSTLPTNIYFNQGGGGNEPGNGGIIIYGPSDPYAVPTNDPPSISRNPTMSVPVLNSPELSVNSSSNELSSPFISNTGPISIPSYSIAPNNIFIPIVTSTRINSSILYDPPIITTTSVGNNTPTIYGYVFSSPISSTAENPSYSISRSPQIPVINASPVLLNTLFTPTVSRPSNFEVGRSFFRSSLQSIGTVSTSYVNESSTLIMSDQNSSLQSINSNNTDVYGAQAGYLDSITLSSSIVSKEVTSLSHIDVSSVIPSSKTLIEIPHDDVSKGTSIFISTAYIPPFGVEISVTMELWILDSSGMSILLDSKTGLASNETGLSLVFTSNSYQLIEGSHTAVILVKDSQNIVVGVASKKFTVRPTIISNPDSSQDRIRNNSDAITSDRLPLTIVDYVNITTEPIEIFAKPDSTYIFILKKTSASIDSTFSAVAIVDDETAGAYTMTVYSSLYISTINSIYGELENQVPPAPINPKFNSEDTVVAASSSDRIKINNNEILSYSHTVGLGKVPLPRNQEYIVLALGPSTKSTSDRNKKILIYTSNNYVLMPINRSSVTPTSDGVYSISYDIPYVNTKVGLLVNGAVDGYIPEDYAESIYYANTDVYGSVTWTSVSINKGDYYSIIVPRYGKYNPLKGVIHSEKI